MLKNKNNHKVKNALQDFQIKEIKDDISALKESYEVLNDHSTKMSICMAGIKKDLEWIKKNYWIVATAAIGGLIAAFFNLLK